ncbi:MAG: NUDIX hydrolase [Hyphomicrobium sp.]
MSDETSETPSGPMAGRRSPRPQDAATLVLVDQSTGTPRVLMGRRRADQVFLPNKYVFPGGRVDRGDRTVPSLDELRPLEAAKLMLAVPGEPAAGRPRAMALAAVRETFEETGFLVGTPRASEGATPPGSWTAFLRYGVVPRLAPLTFFARAITPPGRPRRYDTRFFCADATAIAQRVDATDGELSSLDWFTLADMQGLDLPGITRVVVEDLAERLAHGLPGPSDLPVPFYFNRGSTFERMLLFPAAACTPNAAAGYDADG